MTPINYKTWIPDGTQLSFTNKIKDNIQNSGEVIDSRYYPPREGKNQGYYHLVMVRVNNELEELTFEIHNGESIINETTNSIIHNPLI